MDIETAEKMINGADVDSEGAEGLSCNNCPAANECMDSYITCSAMSIRAAHTIIAARDQRIAELEEELKKTRSDYADKINQFCSVIDERDEARRDAFNCANAIHMMDHNFLIARASQFAVELNIVSIINKYKDAK